MDNFIKKGWIFLSADFIKIWEQALEAIKEEISPIGFKTYVEVMIPRLSDENTVCFLAPSNYHIEVINRKYLDLIANTLMILTNKNYNITEGYVLHNGNVKTLENVIYLPIYMIMFIKYNLNDLSMIYKIDIEGLK